MTKRTKAGRNKIRDMRRAHTRVYTAAIIGCGNVGCSFDRFKPGFDSTHLSAYLHNKKIKLAALCDSDMKKAREYAGRFSIPYVFSDISRMLSSVSPEIVSICTPDDTHYRILKEVADCSSVKAIWCEKPIATTIKDAEEMVSLCRKKGIRLLVNHVRRYDPFYNKVRSGMGYLVGEVQGVNCLYSGGIVTTGSHLLDILDMFFGKCISVSARGAGAVLKRRGQRSGAVGYNAHLFAHLVYENGVHVNLLPCDNKHFSIMEISITGTKARLETINKPFGRYAYRYLVPERDKKTGVSYIANKTSPAIPKDIPRDFFASALSDLLRSVEKGTQLVSSGKVALRSLEVISALSYSSKNEGKEVFMPFRHKNFKIPESSGDVRKWKR